MSVEVMSAVFARYPNGGGEMVLALALANSASKDGRNIFPTVGSLAADTRQTERAVQFQLRRMQAAGWLLLVREAGRTTAREYRISPEWMAGRECVPPVVDAGRGEDYSPPGSDAIAAEAVDNTVDKSGGKPVDMCAEGDEGGVNGGSPPIYPSLLKRTRGEESPPKGFASFWSRWPDHKRKAARGQCEAKWIAKGCEPIAERVIAALEKQKRLDEGWRGEGRFIPAPLVWLNQARWDIPDKALRPLPPPTPQEEAARLALELTRKRLAEQAEAAIHARTPEAEALRRAAMERMKASLGGGGARA